MIHKSEVPNYENRLFELVEEIGNLRYDRLADFLNLLVSKIERDGQKDFQRGRVKLADSLKQCSQDLSAAKFHVDTAWKISKPFMEDYE